MLVSRIFLGDNQSSADIPISYIMIIGQTRGKVNWKFVRQPFYKILKKFMNKSR